jgi:hypothetical protein
MRCQVIVAGMRSWQVLQAHPERHTEPKWVGVPSHRSHNPLMCQLRFNPRPKRNTQRNHSSQFAVREEGNDPRASTVKATKNLDPLLTLKDGKWYHMPVLRAPPRQNQRSQLQQTKFQNLGEETAGLVLVLAFL